MSGIYGVLGLNQADSNLAYVSTFGQNVIADAVTQTLSLHQQDLNAVMGVLVDTMTEAHKERYLLPGGGRMQRMGPDGKPGMVKAAGQWDVAYPLDEFAAGWAASRSAYAYMTMQDLDRHIDGIEARNINTTRFEIMAALFNNADDTFSDPIWGNLTIKPLATGATDGVLYPPVVGSEVDAIQQRYVASGYITSAISDVNDPYPTIVNTLEASFGAPSGGSRIVVFNNQAETQKVTALTEFQPITNRFIVPGDNVSTVLGVPESLPGKILGVHEASGAILCEWRFMPPTYLFATHLDAPPPLKMRVDPAAVGLPRGLTLVSQSDIYPFSESIYSNRMGFGVGNRLNGLLMHLTAGAFAVPPGF